jgi:hypothetical protein
VLGSQRVGYQQLTLRQQQQQQGAAVFGVQHLLPKLKGRNGVRNRACCNWSNCHVGFISRNTLCLGVSVQVTSSWQSNAFSLPATQTASSFFR